MGYDYILLYGDDGYKPRPVPKGCHELQFMDQMIWDQQGNRGEIEDASGQGLQAITLVPSVDDTTKETVKKDSTEKKDSSDNRDSTDKSQKILAKIDTSAVTEVATDSKKEQDLSDNNSKAKKATDVDPEGIHICLLGPCKDDEEDREEEEEDDSKRRKIHHKQKKFLKKFRGKALKIDGRTGCPIPSEAA
ncbi:hypothetical protein BGX24_005106 [Mortierella sp. AD032]|nr:hypothetical protein BGX24_005106 [Mortierella sp. AD032]